jgi:Xaa-Pro aminopeptidase
MPTRRVPVQSDFTADELRGRRQQVARRIGAAVAIVPGGSLSARSEVFRQTNEFYYLSGIETPAAWLTIDGRSGESVLYLPPRNEKQERSDGPGLCLEDAGLAREVSGVDDVRAVSDLPGVLREASRLVAPHQPAEGPRMYQDHLAFVGRTLAADPLRKAAGDGQALLAALREAAPRATVDDLSPVLSGLRIIKSPAEVRVMREAGRLSALGITAAMRATRPGAFEYELAAAMEYVFGRHGARGSAYAPIFASGPRIWNAHYCRCDQPLASGDLVLGDGAPDVRYYTSDIGRMWPVDGRYSALQRELYSLLVDYHRELLARIRPGVLASEVMRETADALRPAVVGRSHSQAIYRQAAERLLDFHGHLSHSVGMAVHDAGDYRPLPLAPGMVFAVDPQWWAPEEERYVRVEDTVVVTERGCEVLTALAPLDLDETERTVQSGVLSDPG